MKLHDNEDKTDFAVDLIFWAHIGCIILHCLKYSINMFFLKKFSKNDDEEQNIFNSHYITEVLVVLKIVLYLVSIIWVQKYVIEEFENDKFIGLGERINCWLLYEVAIFYFHIFAMIFFLLFSRMKSFLTLREKIGFGARMRYKKDFLDYVQNDVHWFLIIVSQVFLCMFAHYYRSSDP